MKLFIPSIRGHSNICILCCIKIAFFFFFFTLRVSSEATSEASLVGRLLLITDANRVRVLVTCARSVGFSEWNLDAWRAVSPRLEAMMSNYPSGRLRGANLAYLFGQQPCLLFPFTAYRCIFNLEQTPFPSPALCLFHFPSLPSLCLHLSWRDGVCDVYRCLPPPPVTPPFSTLPPPLCCSLFLPYVCGMERE